MLSNTSPSFSKIGLAYAQRVTDLEVARETFHADRKKLLKALAVEVRDALARAGLEGAEGPEDGKEPKDDIEAWNWKIDSRFTAAWNEGRSKDKRKQHRSGIALGLDSGDGDGLSFNACLWFFDDDHRLVDKGSFNEDYVVSPTHEVHKELTRRKIARDVWVPDHRWLYVVTSILRPRAEATFTFDAMVEQARRLPKLFIEVDEYLASLRTRRTRG